MKQLFFSVSVLATSLTFAQQINGLLPVITDFSVPLITGFYGGYNPAGVTPDLSNIGQYLFVARHRNTDINNQLQISSSLTVNDRLFFRKIALNSPVASNTAWNEMATRGGNFFTGNQVVMGKVGIGSSNPDEKLTVKGKIHAEEIKIDLLVPADYVFQKYYTGSSAQKVDYKMPSLAEVEQYTKINHHLPNVPSAQEIKENGLYLGEMSNTLLQKIEELTIYIIEQNKKIEVLESKLNDK